MEPIQSAGEEWRNFYTLPAGEYSCVLRICHRDRLHGTVPGGLRRFTPFKELCPLRRSAAIPVAPVIFFLLVLRSIEARRKACSTGRGAASPGLGGPPTSVSGNPKGISRYIAGLH